MYIVKILKRKDGASVVVAVVLAFVLVYVLTAVTHDLATYLSGIEATATPDQWRENVVRPVMAALLQVIVLEAILRLVVHIRPYFVRKKHAK